MIGRGEINPHSEIVASAALHFDANQSQDERKGNLSLAVSHSS